MRFSFIMTIIIMVSAETPKYCPHYRCFFLIITITELRCAALTLYEYREKFPLTKRVWQGIEPRIYSMLNGTSISWRQRPPNLLLTRQGTQLNLTKMAEWRNSRHYIYVNVQSWCKHGFQSHQHIFGMTDYETDLSA